MSRMIVTVAAFCLTLALVACGPGLAQPPLVTATPVAADAATDSTPTDGFVPADGACEPGTRNPVACLYVCPSGLPRTIRGFQNCLISGIYSECVQDEETGEVCTPAPDAGPTDTVVPDASTVLVEIDMLREERLYRRQDITSPAANQIRLGTMLPRVLDPRVTELRASFRTIPETGSRILGSRGTMYLNPPSVAGRQGGYGINGDGSMHFDVTFSTRVPGSADPLQPIHVTTQVADVEDAEGEFANRASAYRMELTDIMAHLNDGSWIGVTNPAVRIRNADAGSVIITSYDGASCGEPPIPGMLNPMPVGIGREEATARLYEVEIRPLGRNSIIGGELRVFIQDERGTFQSMARSETIVLRGTGFEGYDRQANWLACERRRGHITSLRYRFMIPNGYQFAVYPNFVAESADEPRPTRRVWLGSLGMVNPEVCTSSGDVIAVRGCTGGVCNRELTLSEMRDVISTVVTGETSMGTPIVERACIARSFL